MCKTVLPQLVGERHGVFLAGGPAADVRCSRQMTVYSNILQYGIDSFNMMENSMYNMALPRSICWENSMCNMVLHNVRPRRREPFSHHYILMINCFKLLFGFFGIFKGFKEYILRTYIWIYRFFV